MIKNILLVGLVLFIRVSLIYCSGTTAGEFLKLGLSPRAEAMASAYTASDGDIFCIDYNPAGLGSLRNFYIGWQHLFMFDSMGMMSFSAAYPLFKGIMGANFSYYRSGDFTEIGSAYSRELSANCYLLSIAYGKELPFGFLLGGSIKYIYEKYAQTGGFSLSFDIGTIKIFRLPKKLKYLGNRLSTGLTFKNIGIPLKDSNLPFTVSLGVNYDVLNYKIHQLNLFSDLVFTIKDKIGINIGAEYITYDSIIFRLGYKINHESRGLTTGIGISYKAIEINYAFLSFGELGHNHLVGLTLNMGTFIKEKVKKVKEEMIEEEIGKFEEEFDEKPKESDK